MRDVDPYPQDCTHPDGPRPSRGLGNFNHCPLDSFDDVTEGMVKTLEKAMKESADNEPKVVRIPAAEYDELIAFKAMHEQGEGK
jgi:hypothetical protein